MTTKCKQPTEKKLEGKFIVLEGIDGAGTTTQAKSLLDRFHEMGAPAHLTCEPSNGPVGVLIRQILTGRVISQTVDQKVEPVDASCVALLFAADRLDHLHSEIEPALAKGVHVISDRYVLSSLAYQSMDNELEWVREINREARVPDLTVFLRLEPDQALARREATRTTVERFETNAQQKRISDNYNKMLEENKGLGKVAVIDGNLDIDVVTDSIWELVKETIGFGS